MHCLHRTLRSGDLGKIGIRVNEEECLGALGIQVTGENPKLGDCARTLVNELSPIYIGLRKPVEGPW